MTYQEFIQSLRDLIFGPRDCDYVACHFCTWEIDFAVPFLFELIDLGHASNELSMVQAIDYDGLRDKLRVLCVTVMSDYYASA